MNKTLMTALLTVSYRAQRRNRINNIRMAAKRITEADNMRPTATTTAQNGSKEEVVIKVSEGAIWEEEGGSKAYYNITQNNRRNVLSEFYEVITGSTKDDVFEVNGRVFGYKLGGSCDSESKRAAAKEAVRDIINKLISL